jgi:hypothetical protein
MSWFKSNEAIVVDFSKKQVVKKQKVVSDIESEFKAVEIKKIEYPITSEIEEEEVDVSPVNISNISK